MGRAITRVCLGAQSGISAGQAPVRKNVPSAQCRGRIRAAAACRPAHSYFELCRKPAAEEAASAPDLSVGLSNSELSLPSVSGLVLFAALKVPVVLMQPVACITTGGFCQAITEVGNN